MVALSILTDEEDSRLLADLMDPAMLHVVVVSRFSAFVLATNWPAIQEIPGMTIVERSPLPGVLFRS